MLVFATAALLATTTDAGQLVQAASPASAVRFDSGAALSVTVRARIIRASAIIGADHGPPAPRMIPRRTTIIAADGRAVPALVYDFE
ncbi:MAG: hypothetical protein M3Q88_04735 [Pseudomonadota bacterium]|nr:hypothetical protein [Pseudomonadota bacterium]